MSCYIILNLYENSIETLVFDIQNTHIICDNSKTIPCRIYDNNDLHIYSIMQKYYVIYTHSIAKYGIIMLSYKMYVYCMVFLVKTHFLHTR